MNLVSKMLFLICLITLVSTKESIKGACGGNGEDGFLVIAQQQTFVKRKLICRSVSLAVQPLLTDSSS